MNGVSLLLKNFQYLEYYTSLLIRSFLLFRLENIYPKHNTYNFFILIHHFINMLYDPMVTKG